MTSQTQPTTAARAAAEWWATQIGAPTFRMVRDAERDFVSDFAEIGMLTRAHHDPVSPEAGTRFADILERDLAEKLEKQTQRIAARPDSKDHEPSVGLRVDYWPEPILADAAETAGVHTSRFPIKTNMRVCPQYVTASLGYGAPTRLVWSAPDWQRPTCDRQRYEGPFGEEEPRDERCGLPRYHDGPCGEFKPDPKRCGTCGMGYAAHHSSAAYDRADRCRDWFRTTG